MIFPGFLALDAIGPGDVFTTAGMISGRPYEVITTARSAEPVRSAGGLRVLPDRPMRGVRGEIDTLIVVGGPGTAQAVEDVPLIAGITSLAARARRVTSVCTGALLLARAGLLDGRRATTHWSACDELARRNPAVSVERNPIFVRDGDVWTSAGVTAGMDLALALVEDDLGRSVALETARMLVLYVQRPGGQSQFSAQLSAQFAESTPIREIQSWVVENPAGDLTVEALAGRACMSARNFSRVFGREVGMTPAAYVEAVRVERAQCDLETTRASLESIARRCGFGTPDTLRRAFHRRLGVGPSEYRARFRPALDRVA